MTLLELQEKLGEQIELLTDKDTPYAAKKNLAEIAQTVASVAKQMINGADIVMRHEKLVADGKLKSSTLSKMIGYEE